MNPIKQLLICDDDPLFHTLIKKSVSKKFEIKSAYSEQEFKLLSDKFSFDLIVMDIEFKGKPIGIELIESFRKKDSETPIIVCSSHTDYTTVKRALHTGASDYFNKSSSEAEIMIGIERALERSNETQTLIKQTFEIATTQQKHPLIGQAESIQKLKARIAKVKLGATNVMIFGETGCGKEVVARQLRTQNQRGEWLPFVAIDSSTIQTSTAESLLFGHEKGAFTGAEKTTRGLFEEANGGIIYFDEIGNMPLDIQAKLLRVLQEKEITRLGSSKVIELDFRVVCATNRNLEQMVEKGEFKDDLLQRLNVIPLEIPPLRHRKEDIPTLIQHFLSLHSNGQFKGKISPKALKSLIEYDWPGNIRELSNVIAFLVTFSDGNEIQLEDIPPKVLHKRPARTSTTGDSDSPETTTQSFKLYEAVSKYEAKILKAQYDRHMGNITKLAQFLQMDRSHLHGKLKDYGIRETENLESQAPQKKKT